MRRIELRVLKNKPRDRSRYIDLSGSIDVRLIVDSDSYLYVGTGVEKFSVDINKVKNLYAKMKNINERFLRQVQLTQGYQEFASLISGTVVLPGSSIKGNVRTRLELSFHGFQGNVRSCFTKAGIIRKARVGAIGWRHQKVWGNVVFENRRKKCDFTKEDNVCLICDIFGTSGLKSLVDFSDFIGLNIKLEYLDLPYGIKVEAAPPESTFSGRIDFMNLKDYELGLLLLGMKIIDGRVGRRILLGRFKYRSLMGNKKFGRVKFIIDKIKLSNFSSKLTLGSICLNPEEAATGENLDKLCKSLVELSYEKFKDEIEIVDEVEKIDEL
ncbi:MAG: RAMP superfamily CRISPR-associated protein [Candidatus Methanomethylicia archaeon]